MSALVNRVQALRLEADGQHADGQCQDFPDDQPRLPVTRKRSGLNPLAPLALFAWA
jgi:hypothetical protein